MKTHLSTILLVVAAVVMSSSMAAYGAINHNDDVVVQDTTTGSGTSLVLATSTGEASFTFAQQGSVANAPTETWRFRLAPNTDGLSFVRERPAPGAEMFRFTTAGDIFLRGNIVPFPNSGGDICIGNCS